MSKLNGGIIGPDNVPTGAFGSASGVWSLSDVTNYKKQGTWPVVLGGHQVANSCRFDGSGDYIYRTMGTATNRKKFTISAWVKRCEISDNHYILDVPTGSNHDSSFRFHQDNFFGLGQWEGSDVTQTNTQALFRDVSAWYHAVASVDTTQATDSNRVKIYINGVQQTLSSPSYPSQNFEYYINGSYRHNIGYKQPDNARYLDGYLAEMVFIDGQQLTPTSFGETDSVTNNWVPKDVSGLTFGNNGFYLPFTNASALGEDFSGNDNDFTVNNLTSIDQSVDTCTNNFATYNSLNVPTSAAPAFSEGNLKSICNASGKFIGSLTIAVSSGKWFWEVKATELNDGNSYIGVGDETAVAENARTNNNGTGNSVMYRTNGQTRIATNGSTADASYGNSYTQGDIIGVALNADDNQVIFYKNGTAQNSGTPVSIPTPTGFLTGFIALGSAANETFEINTGSPPYSISSGNVDSSGMGNFEYAVPSGYYSLCTRNLNFIG